MHKGEQKDRTKTFAEFPDHISIDYGLLQIACPLGKNTLVLFCNVCNYCKFGANKSFLFFRQSGYSENKTNYVSRSSNTVDNKWNFASDIRELYTKVSKQFGVLVRLRNLIPCNVKLLVYKS